MLLFYIILVVIRVLNMYVHNEMLVNLENNGYQS